jgi:hypothetical protein
LKSFIPYLYFRKKVSERRTDAFETIPFLLSNKPILQCILGLELLVDKEVPPLANLLPITSSQEIGIGMSGT